MQSMQSRFCKMGAWAENKGGERAWMQVERAKTAAARTSGCGASSSFESSDRASEETCATVCQYEKRFRSCQTCPMCLGWQGVHSCQSHTVSF